MVVKVRNSAGAVLDATQLFMVIAAENSCTCQVYNKRGDVDLDRYAQQLVHIRFRARCCLPVQCRTHPSVPL